ncbi:hypothetical protein ACFL2D_01850 [Patescibacteria group bacterium]
MANQTFAERLTANMVADAGERGPTHHRYLMVRMASTQSGDVPATPFTRKSASLSCEARESSTHHQEKGDSQRAKHRPATKVGFSFSVNEAATH